MRLLINKGDKYGNFEVLEEMPSVRIPSGQTNRLFKCKCVCGNEKNIRVGHLVRSRINSCGCISRPIKGLSLHPLYKVWQAIIIRTSGKNDDSYTRKKIGVCDEWRQYLPFYEWAIKNGYEKNLQIDRENNNGDYCPGNCRFVTPIINCNNRENTYFVEYKGVKISFMLLVRGKGLFKHERAIRNRIKRGWDVEKAIDTSIRKGNYKTRIKPP